MKFTFAPEATPLPGYTIKRAIDRGGFGEVYYALADSGKEVALKLLQRNQQIELRGVTQCLNLKHPNLVTIFDIRTDADEDHWVVMEYVAGKSLEQVLEDNPKGLPAADVEQWISGIAAGIGFLHDRGIVHRDLKPANIFRENGIVKIGDIGLSKFITPSRRSAQTESVGTVYYMAPEVAHGKYGSELDVYSLGIMLFEMLTGKVPFDGESTGEILMKHLTEPPDLTKVDARFRPVLARALEKDPQRRTSGALRLADEFRRALAGQPIATTAPTPDSHFVDVPELERRQVINGTARTVPPPLPDGVNGHGAAHADRVAGGAARQLPTPAQVARHLGVPGAHEGAAPTPEVSARQWFRDELRRNPVLAGALALVIVFMVARTPLAYQVFTGRGPSGSLLLLGSIAYLTYWFTRQYHRPPGQESETPTPAAPATQAPPRQVPVRHEPPAVAVAPPTIQPPLTQAPTPAKPKPRPPAPGVCRFQSSPQTLRDMSLRTRMSDLASAMTLSVFWGLVMALGMVAIDSNVVPLPGGPYTFSNPAPAMLFALSTILGAWGVMLPAKFGEGRGGDTSHRRLVQTALGAAVGACIWWVSNSLFVPLDMADNVFPGIFQRAGVFPLVQSLPAGTWSEKAAALPGFAKSVLQPTLAGFVVYFGALFGLRRWWWLADSYRSKRFRISSLLVTSLVAFFIPAAFAFPAAWGVCAATAIAAVVQLSAPWVPSRDRPQWPKPVTA